jgi:hypothetical protein
LEYSDLSELDQISKIAFDFNALSTFDNTIELLSLHAGRIARLLLCKLSSLKKVMLVDTNVLHEGIHGRGEYYISSRYECSTSTCGSVRPKRQILNPLVAKSLLQGENMDVETPEKEIEIAYEHFHYPVKEADICEGRDYGERQQVLDCFNVVPS